MTPTARPHTFETPETHAILMVKRFAPLAILGPALLVAVFAGFMMHRVLINQLGAVFASGVNALIAESYALSDYSPAPTPAAAHFAQIVEERQSRGLLTAVRLRDSDGVVVYSTNAEEIGMVEPYDDAEREALSGEVMTKVVREPLLAPGRGRQLEIVAPVSLPGTDAPVGVVVAFKPYSGVIPAVRPPVLSLSITIFAGGCVAAILLLTLARRAETAIEHSRSLVDNVNLRLAASLEDLEKHHLGTLQALNVAVDAKDQYTAQHSLNVADYACVLGLELGMDDELPTLERAGLLHDVGKIGLAESVLQKPSGLTAEEFEEVKKHSEMGATIVEAIPFLAGIVPAVMHHHERWDGKGYPAGIAGEAIPRVARVLAIADAFDAMTTNRPYRSPMSVPAAKAELLTGRGTQFDPVAVDAFVDLLDRAIISPKGLERSA